MGHRGDDAFRDWYGALDAAAAAAVGVAVDVLAEQGPTLGRPLVDRVKGSARHHMKELRVSAGGRRLRVLFAFDPRGTGIVLLGGDKSGSWSRWYAGGAGRGPALRRVPGRATTRGAPAVSGRTKWAEVRGVRLSTPAERARYAEARRDLDTELAAYQRTLGQLRRARTLTQTQLARSLRVSQAQVSRIETQADLYLSTLRSYVEAMGGELELRVVFPDGTWAEVLPGGEEAVPPVATRAAPGVYVVRAADAAAVEGEVRHVRHHPRGWAVSKPGATRPAAVADTRAAAIARAKEILARRGGGTVVVHPGRRQRGAVAAG